ncbi:TonB-dependent receptor [Undibacterium sp.]|uniref:TonB-dependent receptor n=1 Tax=Undibacterium sp. TaxID=1914977 RepID=UPI0037514E54
MKQKILVSLIASLLSASCIADEGAVQKVVVDGARTSQLGITDAAGTGMVGQKKLEAMTTYRPGELLEAVPGVIVSQHSGEGKANQFFLRGFNLDHGTDLRTNIDDMPVNQRSHAHGQGWTDMNFLIPELSNRIDYKKGPYAASSGDFSSAGLASISYTKRLKQDIIVAGVGQYGYARALLAGSPAFADGHVLYAIEAMKNNGPYTRPDEFKKISAVLNYDQGTADNGFGLSSMLYKGKWNASDQIPERALKNGVLRSRFDTIDTSDGGLAHRYSLAGNWRQTSAEQRSKINAYVINNQLDLYSNFTYFMNDPVNGDQFSQPDRRVTSGLNLSHTWHTDINGKDVDISIGSQLQNDNIFNALRNTRARETISTVRQDHITETSLGLYLEANTQWTAYFRSNVGLRYDRYQFKIKSDRVENSGKAQDQIVSPSMSLVLEPWNKTELFFNLGTGFHSNDARATLTSVDPQTGDASQKSPGLVRSRGTELGLRSEFLPKLQTSIALYRLDFDSELNFVGDAGTTEAGRPSRRIGMEISSSYQVNDNFSIDFDAAYAKARSRNSDPAGQYISGAVEGVAQIALNFEKLGAWSGALRLRYFGPRPLIEDNSVRSRSSNTLNGRISYQVNPTLKIELEGFNLANRKTSAIDYFYASQLKGESAPQEDVHFHPLESRSFRLMLVKAF